MEIKTTTIIKTAEKETEGANYQIEYSIINGVLTRVHAGVYTESNSEKQYIGAITFDNEMIGCSLPANSDVMTYFSDFEQILTQIKEAI